MAATVTTESASGVGSAGFTANGTWFAVGACCTAPCCTVTRRFYYGTSDPPGTLTSAGSVCSETPSDCTDVQEYSKAIGGLLSDQTYYFRANVIISGCGGGSCSGTGNGSVESTKTNAIAAVVGTPTLTPAETSIAVQVAFTPNTRDSTATFIIEYKLDSEPTVWTTWITYTNQSGFSPLTKNTTITGLASATTYDVRGRFTRTTNNLTSGSGTEATTTTLSSQITQGASESITASDSVSANVTGFAVTGEEEVSPGTGEEIELQIVSSANENLVGVWFYHLPTQSYWFWSLDGLTAMVSNTNFDNQNRLWVALGADVYYLDDSTYYLDDHDQSFPLNTDGEFEIPLNLAPKALDGLGAYLVAQAMDVKLGSVTNADPYGSMDIDVLGDVYVGPEARRIAATREVELAPQANGRDEWRSYALPKQTSGHVVSVRLGFSQGETPHRQHPIEIESLRLIAGKTPLRTRRQ